MFRRVIVLVTLATAAAALGGAAQAAPAAATAADPSRLMLARADFPAGTKYTWGRMPASFERGMAASGVKAKGAYFAAELSRSGSTKYEAVRGLVVTTGSPAQARRAYNSIKTFARTGPKSVVRLRSYGDAQIALYQSPKAGSKAEILVRRNSVVWQVEVSGEGLLVIPKATLLAELEKYAAKQKRRVGGG